MNTELRIWACVLAALGLAMGHGCTDNHADDADHAEHEGHDHGEEDHDDHESDEDLDEHGEGHTDVVKLSAEQLERAGVVIEPLGGGTIASRITLPAEVGLNQDGVVHVTPRVPGIVAEVDGFLGSVVEAGTLLAVIESPELGSAKIAYLEAVQSSEIADAELAREREISGNTKTLLKILGEEPEPDELRASVADLKIGENKGRLISAYARVRAARANYEREKELREKDLTTEADLQLAQESFGTTQADYLAAFEDIDFSHRLSLQKAERASRVASSTVGNAGRVLHLLGLSDDQIEQMGSEPGDRVARYELRAPVAGRIVAKHISPGEKLTGEVPVYTLANLDTVWLNISVYTEYATQIRKGQTVTVHAGDRTTTGIVDYVGAMVLEETRTVPARVVLPNAEGVWKPGEFVTAHVETAQRAVARVVPLEAIQTFEGREVVFVQDGDGIEPVPVVIGGRDAESAEILGDEIAIGAPVVVRNSFLMKAELGKSAAGHDH